MTNKGRLCGLCFTAIGNRTDYSAKTIDLNFCERAASTLYADLAQAVMAFQSSFVGLLSRHALLFC